MAAYFVQNLFLFDTPATVLQFVILLGFAAHLEMTSDKPLVLPRVLPSWARLRVTAPFRPSASAATAPSSVAGGVAVAESPPAIAVGAVAVAVTALVATSVFLLNYRPFEAAREIVQIANFDNWSGVAAQFDKSIDAFPPLANYPRFIFITTLAGNWSALTEEEQIAGIEMAERVSEDAFDAEPRLWRVYAALGALYQTASEGDPAYLERARLNVAKAVELAPETALVLAVEARQRTVEEAIESARDGRSAE